jgi:hypothetical protein
MIRNYLKGTQGDKVNTILAAAAFNLRKMLNRIIKSIGKTFGQIFVTLIFEFKNLVLILTQKKLTF